MAGRLHAGEATQVGACSRPREFLGPWPRTQSAPGPARGTGAVRVACSAYSSERVIAALDQLVSVVVQVYQNASA